MAHHIQIHPHAESVPAVGSVPPSPPPVKVFAPAYGSTECRTAAAVVLGCTVVTCYALAERGVDSPFQGFHVVLGGLLLAFFWGIGKYLLMFQGLLQVVTFLTSWKASIQEGGLIPHLPLRSLLGDLLLALCTYACYKCLYVPVTADQARIWQAKELVRAPHMTPLRYRLLTASYFLAVLLFSDYMDCFRIMVSFVGIWYWKCAKYPVVVTTVLAIACTLPCYFFGERVVEHFYSLPEFPVFRQEVLDGAVKVIQDEMANPGPLTEQAKAAGVTYAEVLAFVQDVAATTTVDDVKMWLHTISVVALREVVLGTVGKWFLFMCIWRTREEVDAASQAEEERQKGDAAKKEA